MFRASASTWKRRMIWTGRRASLRAQQGCLLIRYQQASYLSLLCPQVSRPHCLHKAYLECCWQLLAQSIPKILACLSETNVDVQGAVSNAQTWLRNFNQAQRPSWEAVRSFSGLYTLLKQTPANVPLSNICPLAPLPCI